MQVNKLILKLLDNDCAESQLDIDRDEQARLDAQRCCMTVNDVETDDCDVSHASDDSPHVLPVGHGLQRSHSYKQAEEEFCNISEHAHWFTSGAVTPVTQKVFASCGFCVVAVVFLNVCKCLASVANNSFIWLSKAPHMSAVQLQQQGDIPDIVCVPWSVDTVCASDKTHQVCTCVNIVWHAL